MPTNNERTPRKRPSHSRVPKRGREQWEYALPQRERKRGTPQERKRETPRERKRVTGRERMSSREPVRERERKPGRERERVSSQERERKRPAERESVRRRDGAARRPVQDAARRGAVSKRDGAARHKATRDASRRDAAPKRDGAARRKPPRRTAPPQNRRRAVRRRRKGHESALSFAVRAAALIVLLFALVKFGNRPSFQGMTIYHPDEAADTHTRTFAASASDVGAAPDKRDNANASDNAATPDAVTPDNADASDNAAPDASEMEVVAPDKSNSALRKDKFYTVLLAGVDDHNGGSDTVILVGVDGKKHKIFGMSIPRDTKAVIGGTAYKINAAYNIGGMEQLARTVSEQMSIPVDYTVEIDLNGFAALIDAMGGVEFDVPIDMDYEDPKQNLEIHVSKGRQRLDGETALKVVRFRHNSDGSGYGNEDLGRIQTQQNFIKTAARSLLSLSNLPKAIEFAKIFKKYVKTDLSFADLAWFSTEAFFAGSDGIQFATLPGTWKSPYLYTDAESALAFINERLNPYKEDRTLEDLKFPS